MLKKIAFGLILAFFLPLLEPNYRQGFKEGWNEQMDHDRSLGKRTLPKFKNV